MNINYQTFRIYNLLPFPILIKTGEDLATGTPSQNVKVEPNGIFRAGFNVQPEAVCFQKGKKVFVYVSTDAGESQIAVLDPGPGETVRLNAEMIDTAHLSDEMKSALTESGPGSLPIVQAAETPPAQQKSATIEFENQLPFPVRIMLHGNESHGNRLLGGQRYIQHTSLTETWDVYLEGIDEYVSGAGCNLIMQKYATKEHDNCAITLNDMFYMVDRAYVNDSNKVLFSIDANANLFFRIKPSGGKGYFAPVGKYHGEINSSLSCGLYMGKGVISGVPLFYLFVGRWGLQSILYTFSSDRPLCEGEVGLYSGENYTGQCWISNSYFFEGNGVQDIPSLQTAKVKSIKIGPKARLSPFHAEMDPYERIQGIPYEEIYQSPISKSIPTFIMNYERFLRPDCIAKYELKIDTAAQIRKLLSKAVPLRVLNSMSEDYFHEDGKLVQRDVYRTTLIFNRTQKDNSYDLPSKVKIYSDSTCSEEIEVFGKTYSIDRGTCATVQPNSMGRVIVTQNTIHHTSGQHRLGAPSLLIQTDQMNDTDYIHVHPEYQMARKLKEKGHQQDAWLNAKTPAGKHVVPDKYRNKANCDALQKAMHNMASTALYGTHEDATSTHQHLTFDARMMSDSHWTIGPHPSSLEFGYHVVGKDITAEELDALFREIEVIDLDATPDSAVVHAIEKVVHVVVQAVDDAVHVIINGIINGIEKAVKFIVKVAEDIGRALESVLKAIEVAIEDVIDFLKDIFEWKDISHTSSVLHKTMTDALGPNGVPHYLNNYRSAVNSFIREQKQHVDADIQKLFHNTGKTAQPTASGSESPLMEGIEKLEWFLGKITSLDGIGGNRDLTMDALEKFENATLEIAESFTNLAGDAFADIEKVVANLVNHEAPTDAMAPIGTFLEQAVNTVLNDLEIVADDIIDLLIEGLEGIGRVLDESIFQEIIDSIPFIGKLIDFLEKELHFSIGGPSLASSVSLLYAIPVTVISKLISGGHAPFAGTNTLWQTDLSQYGKLGVDVVKAIKEFITAFTNSKLVLQVGAGDEQDTPGVFSLVINTAGMVAGFAGFASTIMFPKKNQTAQDVSVADSALAMFESMLPLMMCAYAKWGENSSFDYGKAQVIVNSIAGISKAALSSVLLGVDPHDETFSKVASLADGVSNASQLFALGGDEVALVGVALIVPLNIASGICYGVAALEAIE